jgi:hypothetical protein
VTKGARRPSAEKRIFVMQSQRERHERTKFKPEGDKVVEIAMTMNFLASRNRPGSAEPSDGKAEGFRAHAAECRELADRCWQEESKERYEELARARRAAAAFRLAA